MDILSRSEARSLGLKRFWNGKACIRGHNSERYVSDGGCIECCKESVERRKKANPEAFRESCRKATQKWSEANEKEYRKKRKQQKPGEGAARTRAYRERHPERFAASAAKTRAKNRDRYLAMTKDYYRRHPEVRQSGRAAYYGRKRGAEGSFTSNDIQEIKRHQQSICNGCQCDLNQSGYHVDHIMPLVLGGSNYPENLQLLCPSCNIKKGGKHPDQWKNEIARD